MSHVSRPNLDDEGVMTDIELLDSALMRLRRLWTAPRTHEGLRAGVGEDIELSTVLVVDAIARGQGPCAVADVAQRSEVAASTASRLVDRAVAAGVVQRQPSTVDARRVDLHLTPAGVALHERAQRFRADYLAEVLTEWTPDSISSLAVMLDAFADAVADSRDLPPTHSNQ